jgi:hypothetical protein
MDNISNRTIPFGHCPTEIIDTIREVAQVNQLFREGTVLSHMRVDANDPVRLAVCGENISAAGGSGTCEPC